MKRFGTGDEIAEAVLYLCSAGRGLHDRGRTSSSTAA